MDYQLIAIRVAGIRERLEHGEVKLAMDLCDQVESMVLQAAQQNAHTKKCLCYELQNFVPDAVPNPDCPIHGAGIK
jgi:hypothetical protein